MTSVYTPELCVDPEINGMLHKEIQRCKKNHKVVHLDTLSLSSKERSVVHDFCVSQGLGSQSKESIFGEGKTITVTPKRNSYQDTLTNIKFFVKNTHLPIQVCEPETFDYYRSHGSFVLWDTGTGTGTGAYSTRITIILWRKCALTLT